MLINKIQTFTALKSGPFAKLWVANWLLYISRNVELVTLSWIVLEITNSPSKVALVGACRMLPMFLLGMSSGSIADRSEKLRLLKLVQAINIIVVVSVVLLLVTDRFEFWHAYIATFLSGTLWTLDFAARRAYYSELFSPSEIVNPASLDGWVGIGRDFNIRIWIFWNLCAFGFDVFNRIDYIIFSTFNKACCAL